MSSSEAKGKGRAADQDAADERTPLLPGVGPGPSTDRTVVFEPPQDSSWTQRLLSAALALLTFFIVGGLVFVITVSRSYASYASNLKPETMLEQGAVVWRGPDDIQVVDATQHSVTVQVQGCIGINADSIMGLEKRRWNVDILEGARRAFGRYLAGKARTVTTSIGDVRLFAPYSRSQHRIPDEPLILVSIPSVTVPLTTGRRGLDRSDNSWLTPISLPVTITPNKNTSELIFYMKDAFEMGRILATSTVDSVTVEVGDGRQWWSPPPVTKPRFEKILKYALPPLPPVNDDDDPISSLIHLRTYAIHVDHPAPPNIYAEADMNNTMSPESPLSYKTIKLPLDMTVSLLPAEEPDPNIPGPSDNSTTGATIAHVTEATVTFGYPNITITIEGNVVPLAHEASPYLSTFISRYLTAQSSPILVDIGPPFPLSLKTKFPGPKERPKIVKSIHMEHMKLYPDSDNGFLASGTIEVGLSLPDALSEVEMDVDRILPDILVFDGPPPPFSPTTTLNECTVGWELHDQHSVILPSHGSNQTFEDNEPKPFPAPPLPTPLPERAWARIRPKLWQNASSTSVPDPWEPWKNITLVTSPFKDLPLQILPGRSAIFRDFIQKIVFKGSAVAGMRGVAAVRVDLEGLTVDDGRGMEIKGMPMEGEFTIRRGSVWSQWRDWFPWRI